MLKVELKSQNLTMTFRNTVAVYYQGGSIYKDFGPCMHILKTGWIYVVYEHEKKTLINSFLHIEAILSGSNNLLTLSSGRILQTKNDLINKLQGKLDNSEWKAFISERLGAIEDRGWFASDYELYSKNIK